MANSGPVAQTSFVDEEVAMHYLLDAIVTVVDTKHAMQQLDQQEKAQRQVGFADKLMLSKTDMVSADEVAVLTARLTRINPTHTPIDEILDIRDFNLNAKLNIDPDFLTTEEIHGVAVPTDHEHSDSDCTHPSHQLKYVHDKNAHHNHNHTTTPITPTT